MVPRRSERSRLVRAIARRWPGERVLLVLPCAGERLSLQSAGPGLRNPLPAPDGRAQAEEGVAAFTDHRLIFRPKLSHGSVLRIVTIITASLGLLTLFAGNASGAALPLGALAAVIAAASVGTEAMADVRWNASVSMARADPLDTVVEGLGPYGDILRLRFADPADFARAAALVADRGESRAA